MRNEIHYVIGRSPTESFADLNARRALGWPPVTPVSASISELVREARELQAERIRGWRTHSDLSAVPTSRPSIQGWRK